MDGVYVNVNVNVIDLSNRFSTHKQLNLVRIICAGSILAIVHTNDESTIKHRLYVHLRSIFTWTYH